MTWDYRVVEDKGTFAIYEVYYNDTGKITAITENPLGPQGETVKELEEDIEYFRRALEMPVLRMGEIVFAPMRRGETKRRQTGNRGETLFKKRTKKAF